MSLFQRGDYRLHSGIRSPFKIDCDFLTPADWDTIAFLLSARVPPFALAVGIPRGGYDLAYRLQPYARTDCDTVLLVDDVFTTGGSLTEYRERYPGAHAAVAFSRTEFLPPWVTALFLMKAG